MGDFLARILYYQLYWKFKNKTCLFSKANTIKSLTLASAKAKLMSDLSYKHAAYTWKHQCQCVMGLYCLCTAFKHCRVHGDLKHLHLEVWKFLLNSPEVMGSTWQVTVTNQKKTLGYKTGTDRVYFSKRVYIRYACVYTCISFTHCTMYNAWQVHRHEVRGSGQLSVTLGSGSVQPHPHRKPVGQASSAPLPENSVHRRSHLTSKWHRRDLVGVHSRATPMASIWKSAIWGTHVSRTAFPCPSRVSRASPRAQRRLLTALPRALTARSW